MLARVRSAAVLGVDAYLIDVEVDIANGLPSFSTVGLPHGAVREGRERVGAALVNAGFRLPLKRITVNLAPADIRKEGSALDLPIALAVLVASGQLSADALVGQVALGEVGLEGGLRPIRGALSMALSARAAGCTGVLLPSENVSEAAVVDGLEVRGAASLQAICAHLTGATPITPVRVDPRRLMAERRSDTADFADVRGQAAAKRALEVAAAGGHSVLMLGSPGTGKSMLAQRYPGLLPPLTHDDALESAAVLSLTGAFAPERWGQRVLRAPHHTASPVALVGGGSPPRPGEISLAHHGVLFLDEFPEFPRASLEALREPLETGRIVISRAARQAEFPARFQLIAAMNPCPCGHLGSTLHACRCTADAVARYQGRISGPLLDRIDVHVEVPAVAPAALAAAPDGEPSARIAARVAAARDRALARQGCINAALAGAAIDRHCALDGASAAFLQNAAARLGWSARGFHRVLRVARSAADLEGSAAIGSVHLAEAIQYRRVLAPA